VTVAESSLVGRLVGHYRIIDRLGEGGMGEVFLAEDARLRRPVALKMLGRRTREDPAGCERLAREARVASLLNHPGIAVVYETGTLEVDGDRRAFIAMEYVAGESLKARLQRGPVEPGEAAGLALQVADALEEAHARGVVHRDIKPANVVLDGRRRPKLLDFGLASYTPVADGEETWSGPESLLPPGALAGTVAYMAPEQARGRSVDARADVFGLGVLLYELLAGHPPFSGSSAVDVLDAVLNAPPPPIDHSKDAPALARALEAVARQMLAKDPGDRLADMGHVKRALLEATGDLSLQRGRPAPSVAVLPFANLTRSAEDDWLGTGLAETVASALGQIRGLAVISRDRVRESLGKLGLPDDIGAQDAPRLGRELSARWIVCGDYQRVGQSVRIAARVVESESGSVTQAAQVDHGGNLLRPGPDRIRGHQGAPGAPGIGCRARGRGDPGRRGLRGLHARNRQPAGPDPRVVGSGHQLLRARHRP
jgi:TolB-like protein/predicted Ser/Thr protein kinase